MYDILVSYMHHLSHPWFGIMVPCGMAIDTNIDDFIRAVTFADIIERTRVAIRADSRSCNKIIFTKGPVYVENFPDFHTAERRIYPSMLVVDDIWDDAALAIVRLSIS